MKAQSIEIHGTPVIPLHENSYMYHNIFKRLTAPFRSLIASFKNAICVINDINRRFFGHLYEVSEITEYQFLPILDFCGSSFLVYRSD